MSVPASTEWANRIGIEGRLLATTAAAATGGALLLRVEPAPFRRFAQTPVRAGRTPEVPAGTPPPAEPQPAPAPTGRAPDTRVPDEPAPSDETPTPEHHDDPYGG
jgi:hypothetical protein